MHQSVSSEALSPSMATASDGPLRPFSAPAAGFLRVPVAAGPLRRKRVPFYVAGIIVGFVILLAFQVRGEQGNGAGA